MVDEATELTARQKLKLVGLVLLAFAVALSWLGLTVVTPGDPGGFLVSSSNGDDGSAAPNESTNGPTSLSENVSLDELREALTRMSRGVSPKAVTAIWATPAYWERADISTDAFRVSPADNHVFIVFMDTHTGALPQMNWTQDAQLLVDGTAVDPVDGYTRAGGYHHMVAVVQFPRTVGGDSLVDDETDRITLRVVGADRTTADVPDDRSRNLTWSYPPPYHDGSTTQNGGS